MASQKLKSVFLVFQPSKTSSNIFSYSILTKKHSKTNFIILSQNHGLTTLEKSNMAPQNESLYKRSFWSFQPSKHREIAYRCVVKIILSMHVLTSLCFLWFICLSHLVTPSSLCAVNTAKDKYRNYVFVILSRAQSLNINLV